VIAGVGLEIGVTGSSEGGSGQPTANGCLYTFFESAREKPLSGIVEAHIMATVLLVDDEPLVLHMVALILEKHGFTVLAADSGSEAIRLSRSHHGEIDLLFSDVVMPGMDGPTLAAELLAEQPALPVLFMSGGCDSLHLDKPFRFVSKPFDLATLLITVRDLTKH
jgi:CheY-like chemotaxis protein